MEKYTGRMVYYDLGLICCDRPAACALTGAPHYKGDDSPCFRCLITKGDLLNKNNFPTRSYYPHTAPVQQKVGRHIDPDIS